MAHSLHPMEQLKMVRQMESKGNNFSEALSLKWCRAKINQRIVILKINYNAMNKSENLY